MRKTKIVCTIGPASESVETLEKLIHAAMNVARLNFSHGNFEEHQARIKNIRTASKNTGKTVAILLDTKGPEIRTRKFVDGEVYINKDDTVYVSMKDIEGTAERFSVTYEGLINDVHKGSKILLDDGLIEIEVVKINRESNEIERVALNSVELKEKKDVNYIIYSV